VLNWVKAALFVWWLAPAVDLVRVLEQMNRHFIRAYDYRVFSLATAATGAWAFIFLFATLACTPLQRLTGLRWPGELRRMLGLFAFFYSVLHLIVYIVIGQKMRFDYAWADALAQKSRIPGWIALILLVPLAVTSTDAMVRRVGAKHWKNLHRLVYVATAFAIAHLAWTDADNFTDFQRTKKVVIPFVILMALRLVPLNALRQKLQKWLSARSSADG
jgi:methionine sulfoxide reductase heme-binding subunit